MFQVNAAVLAMLAHGLRQKGLTQSALADMLGHGRAWASKLMSGQMKTLTDDQVERIEEILGISFVTIKKSEEWGVAASLAAKAEKCADLAELLVRLDAITAGRLDGEKP